MTDIIEQDSNESPCSYVNEVVSMVKFFIPLAKDQAQAEEVYEATKKFAADTTFKPTARRIFRIEYNYHGKPTYAEVGQANPIEGEIVIAILEGTTFMVCTPNRGVVRGMPYLIGTDNITRIVDFEAADG